MKPKPEITTEQLKAGIAAIQAVAEAIRALGSVRSVELYARLMPHFEDLAAYEKLVTILMNAGVVEKCGETLIWVGPKPAAEEAKL